jgi:dTDP-glucose pyrophosphorylase
MEITQFLINKDKNIIQALEKLNLIKDSLRLILFVHDENDVIIGSVTDGDIRRSLIVDKDLTKSLEEICAVNFSFTYDSKNYLSFKSHIKNNFRIIPLLNKEKKLLKVIDLKEQTCILPIEAVIMAGGRGKRLSPLTDTIPKPMLPLGDKPIIEHNIDRLISCGIDKIHISVSYLGDKIKTHFGSGENKNINISYVKEDKPLGTVGSLTLVSNMCTDYILLMNSDLYTNIDLEKMYNSMIEQNADMIIASKDYTVSVPYAIFENESSNQIKSFVEKPKYTYSSNAGIYMFKREFIEMIPKNEFFDITDLINKLLKSNHKVFHHPIRGYWIDIGKLEDYNKAIDLLKYQN